MGNSYGGVFTANVILSFVIPFLLLLWNPVRRSAWGPPLAGLSALAGALMFSVRIFVGGANSGNIYQAFLVEVPPPVYPDVWDIFIVIGGIGAAAFIYMLATKVLPLLSVWEVKEGRPLPKDVPLHPRRIPGLGQTRVTQQGEETPRRQDAKNQGIKKSLRLCAFASKQRERCKKAEHRYPTAR